MRTNIRAKITSGVFGGEGVANGVADPGDTVQRVARGGRRNKWLLEMQRKYDFLGQQIFSYWA